MKETTLMLVLAVAGAVALVDLGSSLKQMAAAAPAFTGRPMVVPASDLMLAAGGGISKSRS